MYPIQTLLKNGERRDISQFVSWGQNNTDTKTWQSYSPTSLMNMKVINYNQNISKFVPVITNNDYINISQTMLIIGIQGGLSIWKSIYILHHIDCKRESNLMINSINVEKALGKILQILWRTINKYLNKWIYHTILVIWKLKL